LAVDVGCGEGRLGRVLASSGHRVVGFDASLTSVRAAATHPQGHPVAVAGAARLPLGDGAADLAIAFMSLHDFDDLPAAIAEVARILAPDGQFCIALLHPVVSARMTDGYAAERRYSFMVERAGLQMTYQACIGRWVPTSPPWRRRGLWWRRCVNRLPCVTMAHPTSTSFTFAGA
jgi:SAM-dependent methyltransferase